jgi:riboflavin synthase
MFTGIIENFATVTDIFSEGTNKTFTLRSDISKELKVDQSVAHDGVCLTVINVDIQNSTYQVTAIEETLHRTTLQFWKTGSKINLERSMSANQRIDGHFVQGHVDTMATVLNIESHQGSWTYLFEYDEKYMPLIVEKGSVAINGISLTVVSAEKNTFSVGIIPYTYEHTNIHTLQKGSKVNVEFDILGKYIQRFLSTRQ